MTARPGSLWSHGVVGLGLLGGFLFLAGGTWDLAWHIELGRDTFFSPPHLMLYAGLALGAAVPLAALLVARRYRDVPPERLAGPTVRRRGLPVSPGAVVAGIGGLLALLAGPVDEAWHALFGLDVTIWSPPHVQLIAGAALSGFGMIVALCGELNRARPERLRAETPAFVPAGPDLALSLGFGLLLHTLLAVLAEYAFSVNGYALFWHPLLLPVLVMPVFAAARRASGAWGATRAAIAFQLLDLAFQLVVLLAGRSTTPTAAVLVPAAVAFDLLLERRAAWVQAVRGAVPAALASLVLLASQLWFVRPDAFMPWRLDRSPWIVPAAVLLGAAAAVLGRRVGQALRPVPAATRQALDRRPLVAAAGVLAVGLGLAALSAAPAASAATGPSPAATARTAVAAAVQATTPDASAEPRLYLELLRGPVVAGEPSQVRLRFDPPAAARPETLEARLQHDGAEQPLPLRPGAAPGELTADVALPDPGLWIIPLRFRDAQDRRWLGWASIRAVTDPDAYAPVLPTLRVRLQPDRTIPDLPLTPLSVLGTALVLLTIAAAVVGSAVALRAVERDAGSVSAA